MECHDQFFYIFFGIVDGETDACGSREIESVVKRGGALEAGSDADTSFAEEVSSIVGMNALKCKRNDATFLLDVGSADDSEGIAKCFCEATNRVGNERLFMLAKRGESDSVYEVDCGTEADTTRMLQLVLKLVLPISPVLSASVPQSTSGNERLFMLAKRGESDGVYEVDCGTEADNTGDILDACAEETLYKDAPARFEAGTPNIAGVIGLGSCRQ